MGRQSAAFGSSPSSRLWRRAGLALLLLGCGVSVKSPTPIQEQPPIRCSLPTLCRLYVEPCSCKCTLIGPGLVFPNCLPVALKECSPGCEGRQAVCLLPSLTCELR
jgi:hypothetical protein